MNQSYDSNGCSFKITLASKKDLMCGTLTKMKYLFWEFEDKKVLFYMI